MIHSSETLAVALETVSSMIHEHDTFLKEDASLLIPPTALSRETSKRLSFQESLLKCLHLRSKALEERLRSEIALVVISSMEARILLTLIQAFNTVAQHESRIAARIAEATQVDSAAMRTVSILGLFFLPGTFVCVRTTT